jgi:hypothetical protein
MLKSSRATLNKNFGDKGKSLMTSHLYMNHPGHAIKNPQHGKFTKVKVNEGFVP